MSVGLVFVWSNRPNGLQGELVRGVQGRGLAIQRWPSLSVVPAYQPSRVVPAPAYSLRRAYSSPRNVHSRYSASAGGRHVRRKSIPPTLVRRLESGSVPYSAVPPSWA